MRLTKDVELIDGLPIAFIKSINAVAISDLHLGYEGIAAKAGVYAPKSNLKKIEEMIGTALEKTGATTIIVTGDIKNEFSSVDIDEYNEMLEFVRFAKRKNARLILIKGNHDNFVDRYKTMFDIEIFAQEMQEDKYLFFHGEEMPKIVLKNARKSKNNEVKAVDMLVMGHEHPAISLISKIRRREKLKCFLFGEYRGKQLLVLPAINYLMPGTDINLESKSRLLSPILKKVDIDRFHAIVVGYDETLDFGTISDLRQ